MIRTIKKDTATYPIIFFMVDSTDHVTGKTGLSPTVTLSKNGAAFGAAAGAVTEIGNGFYKVAGNATDSNTLGSLLLHAEGTAADDTDMFLSVVDYNPYDMVTEFETITPSLAVSSVEAALVATGSMALSARYTMDETVSSTLTDDLSAATKLWFAIKESGETDANSLIFCEETAGLTIVDKTAYGTAAHGTITVSGSTGDWEVAIMIDEVATALLSAYANNNYDASVKALISGKAVHVWDGKCRITLGVIEAVS